MHFFQCSQGDNEYKDYINASTVLCLVVISFDGLFVRNLTHQTCQTPDCTIHKTVTEDRMLFNSPLAKHMSTIDFEKQLDYLCQWLDSWTDREVSFYYIYYEIVNASKE